MNRRSAIVGFLVLMATGCSTSNGAMVPSLGEAQNWASSVVTALTTLGEGLIADGSVTEARATTVQSLVERAQATLASFMGLQPGAQSTKTAAEDILSAVQELVPLLSLQPGVSTAVQLAISVLNAFVQEIPMSVPAVPATLHRLAGSRN